MQAAAVNEGEPDVGSPLRHIRQRGLRVTLDQGYAVGDACSGIAFAGAGCVFGTGFNGPDMPARLAVDESLAWMMVVPPVRPGLDEGVFTVWIDAFHGEILGQRPAGSADGTTGALALGLDVGAPCSSAAKCRFGSSTRE